MIARDPMIARDRGEQNHQAANQREKRESEEDLKAKS